MSAVLQKVFGFIKKESVLCAALLLAVVSAFIVLPDDKYIGYIDWNTLLLLFALMAVMAGLQKQGVFRSVGAGLLRKTGGTRSMLIVLVALPFFFSMLITNDVALITFVPFGIAVLRMAGQEKLLIPLVVMQTIAANLGSMLTPMGNPQNLYLYAKSGMAIGDFLLLMLPYTAVSALCLALGALLKKSEPLTEALPDVQTETPDKKMLLCYGAAFLLCLLSVAKVLPPVLPAAAILIFLIIKDRGILKQVDYSLLLTFIGFFVFIGNMGRIEGFRAFLTGILGGHECIVSVLSSQVISNVPAALLLSGFSDNWSALIVGTNLGGLGTLIASMASLISYKQIAKEYPARKGRYLLFFTAANVIMLAILLCCGALLFGQAL